MGGWGGKTLVMVHFPFSRLRKYFKNNCSIITSRNMFNNFFFPNDILPLSYLLKAHKNTFSTQSNDLLLLKGSLLDILNSKNMACNLRYLMKTKSNRCEIYTHVPLWICTKHHHHLHHLFLI